MNGLCFIVEYNEAYGTLPNWKTLKLAHPCRSQLAFYDFPAEHWTHIRTSNVIELAFGTVRHRTKRTNGCVTRQTMLALVFNLGMCAQKRFRRLREFESLAKVITGVKFKARIEVIQKPHHRSKTDVSRVAA
jgi:hypothetical protein